ncbi:MAG: bifunctional sugar-1-phosphate nucleotidylyltransferase/acetyltransferase [Nanoarchaeota archaeon]
MKPLLNQAVLLCAGRSTRAYPLTANRPKPLLKVANVTLLEHNLLQLEGLVKEVIIITGFETQQIKDFVSNLKIDLKIKTVQQERQLGTGHAVLQAQPQIRGRFLVLNGDVMYSKLDISRLAKSKCAVLGISVEDSSQYGVILTKAGFVTSIVEKPQQKMAGYANAGAYVFDENVFVVLKKIKKSTTGEYYLTEAIGELAKTEKVELESVKDYWLHISYPWDLLSANEFMLSKMKHVIAKDTLIEKGVTLKGTISVGSRTVIKSGVYIEGPVVIGKRCIIGPNCYIRPGTSIGDDCKIGSGCEVKNTVLLDGAVLSHLCYVGDSIIGRNANLAGGTITANLRHDRQPVSSMVNGNLVSTGRVKFGTVMGDNAKTGINTSIYPGRKIWPFKATLPGEVVRKDII